MNFKNIIVVGGLVYGAYWLGKIIGVCDGAKTILNRYDNLIVDDKVTINMVRKPGFIMSVTARKK